MIVHIVGNRPQFIKLAPFYQELKKRNKEQLIIHTGQHYDENMSQVFFQELNIPEPYVNLHVGSGTHAQITGNIIINLEECLEKIQPELAILYGDTDSTLAAAITCCKLGIKIAHVEGGVRTHLENNPEECNRIVVDHLSKIIFCPDKVALDNLKEEGLGKKAYYTGDIMFDTYLSVARNIPENSAENIVLMTWHRQENTASKERMESIIALVEKLHENIVCPLHPRTVKCLKEYGLFEKFKNIPNMKLIEPVGYVEMVELMQRAKLIVTDSGGLSKESSFAGAKCIFLLNLDIWVELQNCQWICRVDPQNTVDVERALSFSQMAERVPLESRPRYYGDGHCSKIMADLLSENGYI